MIPEASIWARAMFDVLHLDDVSVGVLQWFSGASAGVNIAVGTVDSSPGSLDGADLVRDITCDRPQMVYAEHWHDRRALVHV
jgi:hypothetical protein